MTATTARSPWIIGRVPDLLLVLLTPIIVGALVLPLAGRSSLDTIVAFALVLSIGHYLPGMLRAYGDPTIFRRFRTRLLLAPIVLLVLSTTFAFLDLEGTTLLIMVWGGWHWMMQIYGFGRVYDARAGSTGTRTAQLDRAFCVVWFVTAIALLNPGGAAYVRAFYESGGPALSGEIFRWFGIAWAATTGVVTVVWLAHLARQVRAGRPPSLQKLVLLVVTFGWLGFTAAEFENPFLGYILFESCHDVQYLAIVWAAERQRVGRSDGARAFSRFLFSSRALGVLAYVAVCLVFGTLALGRSADSELVRRVAVSLIGAFAMLHYYLDGFIWKIRDESTATSLGLAPGSAEAGKAAPGPASSALSGLGLRHGVLWLILLIPAATFFSRERAGLVSDDVDVQRAIAETFPTSPRTRIGLCGLLLDANEPEEALPHCAAAVTLRPEWSESHYRYARALLATGGEGEEELRAAIALDPEHAHARAHLGMLLGASGRLDDAALELRHALSLEPEFAEGWHNLAVVRLAQGDPDTAVRNYEQALELEPDRADTHKNLGAILAQRGDLPGAQSHFEAALNVTPDDPELLINMGHVNMMQGNTEAAYGFYDRAIAINPALQANVPPR